MCGASGVTCGACGAKCGANGASFLTSAVLSANTLAGELPGLLEKNQKTTFTSPCTHEPMYT